MESGIVEALLGILGAINLMLLGWLHMRHNKLADKLDEKVDHQDFKKTQQYLEKVLEELIGLKVEIARWQGRAEAQEKN